MHGQRTPRTLSEAVGRVVNARRKELGISVDEFAVRMRMSKTSIYSHSNGKHSPSLSTLEEYAHVLRLDIGNMIKSAQALLVARNEASE